MIRSHLVAIGADRPFSSDQELAGFYQGFYDTLVVNNPRFPRNLPIAYVLRQFFKAIMYHAVELKGHNMKAHVDAFGRWMITEGEKVRDKWLEMHPPDEKEVKRLAPPPGMEHMNDNSPIEKWPLERVQRQLDILETIYDDDISRLLKPIEGFNDYTRRLIERKRELVSEVEEVG